MGTGLYAPHQAFHPLVRSRSCRLVWKSNLQRDLYQLWHTVLRGAGDDLVRDGERQLTAGINVAAVVDAGPDPRLGRFVAKSG